MVPFLLVRNISQDTPCAFSPLSGLQKWAETWRPKQGQRHILITAEEDICSSHLAFQGLNDAEMDRTSDKSALNLYKMIACICGGPGEVD